MPSPTIDITGSGDVVVFRTNATDLVEDGAPGFYRRDREAGTTTRIDPPGASFTFQSQGVAISDDGTRLAFTSRRADIVLDDTNDHPDAFLVDETGEFTRLNVGIGGAEADHVSWDIAMSGDGGLVAFSSFASNLVAGDTNQAWDVFAVEVPSGGAVTVDGCDFRQDKSEDDVNIQQLAEQGRDAAVLCAAIPIDISLPGTYGKGFSALTPGQISAGTAVRSFLVHADRAYPITTNGDYLERQLEVTFTGGTVLGLAVRDASLDDTDVLAAPGTLRPTGLEHRGTEINVKTASNTWLNPKDGAILSADRTTVRLSRQVGEAMDQVRIITTPGATIASGAGYRLVAPPPSLRQDAFDTVICPTGTQPIAKRCDLDKQKTDDVALMFEQHVQHATLGAPLVVNIAAPGTYSELPASSTIAAGTKVRTVLLHTDRLKDFDELDQGDFRYFRYRFTFPTDVLGIVTSDAALDASDFLGAAGVLYPTGWAARGADFDLPAGNANDEKLTLSADRRTLDVQLQTGNGMDELRVVLAP